MLRLIKKTAIGLLATANVIVAAGMAVSGYSGHISPTDHTLLSASGLAFPIFLAANVAFLIVWLVVRRRMALLPAAALLACYGPIHTYIPLNLRPQPPEGSIKVLSYNVHMFEGWNYGPGEGNLLVDYLLASGADILCLQEAFTREVHNMDVDSALTTVYPYIARTPMQSNEVALLSKYPILSCEQIEYPSTGNVSAAARVLIDGDTVLVVNNHLETYGLTPEEKEEFQQMVEGHGQKGDERTYLSMLTEACRRRAPQAEAVAAYIASHPASYVVVCGDFNDHPLSYAHHTIGRGLTDCFATAGCGTGFTYDSNRMYVRIDHIFCSHSWQCYRCEVDRNTTFSDHYPISVWLKKRPKR